jgi:hypothetical protein
VIESALDERSDDAEERDEAQPRLLGDSDRSAD